MGIIVAIKPRNTFINQWSHKLFGCPTFWKSKLNTFWKSKPYYRCPKCKKAMHCYWDGNDTKKGTDFCKDCSC